MGDGISVRSVVGRLLPRIRYPYLLLILGALLAIDLVIPDPIPLVDEIVLAVLTFLAASWRTPKRPPPQLPEGD